jgi:hypothetical protein
MGRNERTHDQTVAEFEELIYHAAGCAGFPAAASGRDGIREALKKSRHASLTRSKEPDHETRSVGR